MTTPISTAPSRKALVAGLFAVAWASTGFAQGDGAWSPESFNGVWLIEEEQLELRTADGSVPPLLPEAARVYESNRRSRGEGDSYFDRATWCASPGIPRLQLVAHPFEIMVNPLMVGFFYEWNRWARLVDLTGASFEVLYPMSFGTASGRFEGEALVIVTRGLMSATVLDSAGMPHSDDLVMTETFRLLDADRLENRIRFEDAATFAGPWETVVTYRRQAGARIREDVCLDRIGRGEPAI
jgi:hypothetical protein